MREKRIQVEKGDAEKWEKERQRNRKGEAEK
jgi:hypothetical protein